VKPILSAIVNDCSFNVQLVEFLKQEGKTPAGCERRILTAKSSAPRDGRSGLLSLHGEFCAQAPPSQDVTPCRLFWDIRPLECKSGR